MNNKKNKYRNKYHKRKLWLAIGSILVIIIIAITCIMLWKQQDAADEKPKDEPQAEETPVVEEPKKWEGVTYNDGIADPFSIEPEIVKDPNSIQVLVNKFYALPQDWEPDDLVEITSNNERIMMLRKEAAEHYEQMRQAAEADGIIIRVVSSFRTKEYQQSLFDNYYVEDQLYALKYSALPRRSEHETGLTVDISHDAFLYDDLDDSELGKWMDQHAQDYGFIMRFPEGKETITHYGFEPWHYRYVGIDLAKKIKESGLTMEEYFNK